MFHRQNFNFFHYYVLFNANIKIKITIQQHQNGSLFKRLNDEIYLANLCKSEL